MMLAMIKLAAWISAIFGVALLFFPRQLAELNKSVNKILLDIDSTLYRLRVTVGVLLCLSSATLFFVIYYLAQRFGVR